MTEGTVSKIMATDVFALDRNASLGIAKEIMDQRRLRHFPVVEHGNVVGVVSQRDLFRASLAPMLGYEERTKKAFLDNLSIKGIMSDPPITVTADTGISEAARLMVEKKVGCLPVVDGKRLIGLVTETDFLKVLAGGLK
jgi:CBS domain-containing protein